jgi:hypothetical protein
MQAKSSLPVTIARPPRLTRGNYLTYRNREGAAPKPESTKRGKSRQLKFVFRLLHKGRKRASEPLCYTSNLTFRHVHPSYGYSQRSQPQYEARTQFMRPGKQIFPPLTEGRSSFAQ